MTEPWLLGRYEVVAELGKGAMGVVYRANDPMLNRMVAIKTINTEEAGHEGMAEYEARFYTEAKAAGGLNHPSIIIVYDIGKSGHLVYMAMEYVEGKELREMLADGKPLAVAKAVDIAAQVADGLAYAHQHQVVHRDIKPANIMITPDGRAKIADFGIARMRSSETRTQTGVILGSPKYISPEQVVGKRADHRSDIFSLGVILYECITGSTPFNGEGLSALMYQITNHDPAPPSSSNSEVPVMLDYIIAKVLAKAPEARYQSAADFANDLRECKAQIETGQSAPGAALMTTSRPIPVASVTAAQPAPAKLQEVNAEATTDPSPTRGISRSFDSQEATQRLLAQMGEDGRTEFVSTRSISGGGLSRERLRPGERPWGHRENVIFAATVVVAVVIATAIVLI
ncbi:MAG TPA: serine/threonine-protein kinase [Burkholderiales bacterium]|nr:serine/threonine-protein kinase [Burkholderiales bacterium]